MPPECHQKLKTDSPLDQLFSKLLIMLVPNIVNITYGRGVGYTFEEEVFDKSITEISATKIRKKLREEGKL